MRGLGSKILCHEAVKVTATSHDQRDQRHRRVTRFPILMMMVVATHSATVASN